MNKSFNYTIEEWGPHQAGDALKHVHEGQRGADPAMVAVFTTVIKNGRWHPGIGAPIAFDEDGVMQNGVHRATAISKMPRGSKVPVLVFRDMPLWAITHFDTGKNRTMGNFLKYAFPQYTDTLCRQAASIASFVMAYRGPGALPRPDVKQRPETLVQWAIDHGERLFAAARAASQIIDAEDGKAGSVMTVRSLGFILYYLPEAEEFFRVLAARTFDGSDPRQDLTNYYYRQPFPKGATSRVVTQQRVADLLGAWDVFKRNGKWRKWDGEEKTFRHPQVSHEKAVA